jgi:hypothetical protein
VSGSEIPACKPSFDSLHGSLAKCRFPFLHIAAVLFQLMGWDYALAGTSIWNTE